jgi:hypothetical protein
MPQQQLQEAMAEYIKQNMTPPKIPENYYYYQNQLNYSMPNPYAESETETEMENDSP